MPGRKAKRRPVSQAQRRWAYATARGDTDAPVSVGKEFVAGDKPGKLPERKRKKAKRVRHAA